MGASLSQIIPYFDQARRLANPEPPLYYCTLPAISIHHGLMRLRKEWLQIIDTASRGNTVLGYQIQHTKFDTGLIIIINYERNFREPCLENQILNSKGHMPLPIFHEEALPTLLMSYNTDSYYAVMINFRTMDGVRIFKPTRFLLLDEIPYNDLPDDLTIPRVPISDLVAPEEYRPFHVGIDVVRYKGELYVFKHHGRYPLITDGSSTWNDSLLNEIIHLAKFDSPFILPAPYVIHGTGKLASKFRGYLQPFAPAGSLHDVLKLLNDKKKEAASTVIGNSAQQPIWSKFLSTATEVTEDSLLIAWTVKHRWAIDMVSGLVVLHKAEAFVGLFDLQTFILNRDGHIAMIDIAPSTGFNSTFAPPEVDDGLNVALTGPRDIFSLGLILWMLAEESFAHLHRASTWLVPKPTWHDGPNSAPQWFRTLIQECIHPNPALRPPATVLLSRLVANARANPS